MELFYDKDVPETVERLAKDPLFEAIAKHLWPNKDVEELKNTVRGLKTVKGFQLNVMHSAINNIVKGTSTGLTFSGIERLEKGKAYLFIANHRDILLDTAILQVLLLENGHETSEITFGDNLKKPGFVSDLCNLNRMLSVKRTGTARELYSYSKDLSEYVRKIVGSNKNSVWLAQRGGRTKDGADITQPGLLKMLNMTGEDSLVKNYNDLNIVPLAISFEYETCDDFKTQETYAKNTDTAYEKTENEDMESIRKGILEPKGRIHMHFGNHIVLDESGEEENENVFIKKLAKQIDKEIFSGYKLWPTNYLAMDKLENSTKYSSKYTDQEKKEFELHIENKLSGLTGSKEELFKTLLNIYANPVLNKYEMGTSV